MSLETRSSSALFKRAEQLKRWEESDTNREPVIPKQKSRKVKFSSGCVFLAACAAGDKKEVLELLHKGADINTANVDGLTALHQACIDDNLDMVEFLVENGADVNRGDNEGWTPLHATASCGFLSIAKYLVEKGANVAAVNNDGQLAIDIAECQKMEELLKEEIDARGIDCEAARNEEETLMLRDAKDWLATKSSLVNASQSKNGVTALHVACAKGYTEVIKVLLQCGADIDAQDNEGWTPLHAGAHWGHKEACQILAENLADMEIKNFVGQTALDLCDSDMSPYMDELKKKQNKEDVFNRRMAKKRVDVNDRNLESETPNKVKKVDVKVENESKVIEDTDMDVSSECESDSETTESSSESESESSDEEKKNKLNAVSTNNEITSNSTNNQKIVDDNEQVTVRRKLTKQNSDLSPTKINASNSTTNSTDTKIDAEVTLRKPLNEPKTKEEEKKDVPTSLTVTVATNTPTSISPEKLSPVTSPQPGNNQLRSGLKLQIGIPPAKSAPSPPSPVSSTPTTPTTPGGTRLQMLKNFFKSFVPPVRDEESETQRKAHAKRVRETRRSTQGVTLEEIKSAEQLVKQKNQSNGGTANTTSETKPGDSPNGVVVTATITTGTTTVLTRDSEELPSTIQERRPSWRLRVDNGSSKFLLEDATKPASELPSTPSFIRRSNPASNIIPRPPSASLETADTTITLPLRKPKSVEEKDQDKENDIRNAQATLATQAAIQRRRRPKRRSTGVVSFDNVDDLDQEKDSSSGKDCDDTTTTKTNHLEFHVRPKNPSRTQSSRRPPVANMSFFSKQNANPRRRSSSAVRTGSTASSYNRPRSMGHYASNPYSSPYSGSSASPYSSFASYASPSSNYQSPYFANGYRGAAASSGYASLKIPAKNLLPSYAKKYDYSDGLRDAGHSSRRDRDLGRAGSYRERSLSRSRGSLVSSGMGSRSISLTSLNSEGYISGTDRSSKSRLGSSSDIRNENGEIDYKKLYEQELAENERLKDKLRKNDEELRETKQTLEKINLVTSKNSLSELEKRERRAMERKLSEMEEELKNLENLKSENQRLKDENGALIRVISKLSK